MYAPPLANGCDLAKKVARPGDAAFVLAGRRPTGEHVHDVVGVPGRVGHRIGRDAGRLAADRADSDPCLSPPLAPDACVRHESCREPGSVHSSRQRLTSKVDVSSCWLACSMRSRQRSASITERAHPAPAGGTFFLLERHSPPNR